MEKIIERVEVPDADRMGVVDDLFGLMFPLAIEPVIYNVTQTIAREYSGGFWNYYKLTITDGSIGFYMAPDADDAFEVFCEGNHWRGTLSPDALGIVVCLTTYSHLSFGQDARFGQLMAQHYHRLRAYMLDHAEAPAILGATD
jgi:hypothetical protein